MACVAKNKKNILYAYSRTKERARESNHSLLCSAELSPHTQTSAAQEQNALVGLIRANDSSSFVSLAVSYCCLQEVKNESVDLL
uniref:Uncharacterized protein n=1 Tax=Poecilia latipinna TaxID=48699 RepID=A0A3B3UJB2_9TELE